jgi:hypothetical protein
VGRRLDGGVEEADGRGEPGRRRRVREAGGGAGEEGRPEDEDEPDRWAPPVGEREREERGGGFGGPLWADSGCGPR